MEHKRNNKFINQEDCGYFLCLYEHIVAVTFLGQNVQEQQPRQRDFSPHLPI